MNKNLKNITLGEDTLESFLSKPFKLTPFNYMPRNVWAIV